MFFLHGDEHHLREEAVQLLMGAHLDPATRDFNLDPVRGGEVGADQLASLIATPPMMAEWRTIVVRDAQQLASSARDAILAAAAAPPPGLALVVSATIPAGSKARFYSQLKKTATSLEFSPLAVDELPGWLMERASTVLEVTLEPEAARELVVLGGSALGPLITELDKLAEYVDPRETICVEDVRETVAPVTRADRWKWFDTVGERRLADALRELPDLLDSGENGVGLVIGLGAHLLRVALAASGGSRALEQELKPYQRWMARRIAPQARRWTASQLDGALAELLRADRLLKSASLTDRQVVEELLLRLHALGDVRSAA
ncbi:MAG: DNA polymerase III subunit delta [Longimicrobiaceae bacterium]